MAGHRLSRLLVAALLGSCLAAPPAQAAPPSFVPADTVFATGWWPVSAVADLNDDGRADIVVGGGGGLVGSVTVELAQPGGGYAAAGTYPVGGELADLRLVDVSGDDRLDIIAAGQWDFTVLHAQPGGGYAEAFSRSLSGDVGIADLDGDGRLDLAYTFFGAGDVFVASAQPDGTYAVQAHPVRGLPKTVQIWDWTGDGRLDVLAVTAGVSGVNSLLAGVPGGLAPAVDSYAGWDDEAPILADFDGDGDTDRAQLRHDRWGVIVRTARGDGEYDYREHWPGGKIRQGPLAGDFDGDGRTDLAMLTVTDAGTSRLTFLLGSPDETFAKAVHHPLRANSRADFALDGGELDGDGRPDLIVGEDRVVDEDGHLGAAVRVWSNRTPIVTLSPPAHTTARSVELPYTMAFLGAVEQVRLEVKAPGATEFAPHAVLDLEASGTISIPTEQDGEWRFRATAYGPGGRVLDTTEAVTDIERPTTLAYSQEPIGSQPVGFESEPKRIRIENRGEATLRVRGVTVGDGAEFKLVRDECSGRTFAPNGGCDVYVMFTPAGKGERTGTLMVDGNVPPTPLDLRGTGVAVTKPGPPPAAPGPQFPAPRPASPPQRAPRLAFVARPGPRTTKLKRLRVVQLAPGTTVSVRCPRGCSRGSLTKRGANGTLSLASFARARLRAGTAIRVVIAEPGKPRVVLTLKIRAGRAPSVTARQSPQSP